MMVRYLDVKNHRFPLLNEISFGPIKKEKKSGTIEYKNGDLIIETDDGDEVIISIDVMDLVAVRSSRINLRNSISMIIQSGGLFSRLKRIARKAALLRL